MTEAATEPSTTAAEAEVLASRICCAASLSAQSQCGLLELIGEFDAVNAINWWQDVKSLAHWLSWSCSMSPGTAREHVRVARALRQMPTVTAAFREGQLSYSKVREVTRVVGLVDEAGLCELALSATASQLARMVSGYRRSAGSRIHQEAGRGVRWTERDSGVVDVRIRLPKEEAALLRAAINAAEEALQPPPEETEDATPAVSSVDAVLELSRVFLASAPADRSGEDRTTVLVQVSADQLAEPQSVPAGTSTDPNPVCQVPGLGGLESATAQKLSCDADLIGAVIDTHGDVLALGRTHRLVSRAQRRALMIRDHGMCQFPGCHQSRYLKAHHVVHWSAGGPTDLSNLMLLCQFHHTAVHEGNMIITAAPSPESGAGPMPRWTFRLPDGSVTRPWYTAAQLTWELERQSDQLLATHQTARAQFSDAVNDVDGWQHPDAERIRPTANDGRFDLHECVRVLFELTA